MRYPRNGAFETHPTDKNLVAVAEYSTPRSFGFVAVDGDGVVDGSLGFEYSAPATKPQVLNARVMVINHARSKLSPGLSVTFHVTVELLFTAGLP